MARRLSDEYDPDEYVPPADDRQDAPRIDPEDHAAEWSLIQAVAEREMMRTARAVQAFTAPWCDRYCTTCNGTGRFAEIFCPDCCGTGAESFIRAPSSQAEFRPVHQEAAE